MINQEDIPNLIKIRSLIAPGFVMSRIKLCATQPQAIKDRILIRLGHTIDQSEIPLPSNGFYGFAVAVGRQRAMHTENSGFASPALGQHISTFRGYRILFSIRNPYINRFTDHFSIHS